MALIKKELLLLDGGLGTTLEDEHRVVFSQETPLWSSHLLLSDPETLSQVQHDFAEAGADIILTPTYQVSRQGFVNSNVNPEYILHYLQSAVAISRKASHGLVALSLGAFGATLQPSQEYSGAYGAVEENDLTTFHAQRLADFESRWDNIDIVAFETLPRLDEVRAVKQAYQKGKPYWISCVFPNEDLLPDGTSVEELLPTMLAEPRPWAIGLNCTKLRKVEALVAKFEKTSHDLGLRLPRLVIYPDGTNGLVYDTVQQKWVGEELVGTRWDETLADIVQRIRARGRWEGLIVGGCCKTAPRDIAKLRKRLDDLV